MHESAFFTATVNSSCGLWSDLKELVSARPLVSTTNCASTVPSTPAVRSMSGYFGWQPPAGAAGFSTWNSKYGWSLTIGCGTPPSTPLATPPATPLPVKSASSVTFLVRSMSGSTSGISTGAVSTWKPFGGGGATTTSGGGGAFSGSGGGSSFFTSTNSTFSSFG